MGYVKLTGNANRHENWTTEFILEKDEDGNPTKVVEAGVPIELSKDEQSKLEALGATFEDSSASEHKEVEEARASGLQVGSDVANAGPRFGVGGEPNQTVDQPDEKSSGKKSNN